MGDERAYKARVVPPMGDQVKFGYRYSVVRHDGHIKIAPMNRPGWIIDRWNWARATELLEKGYIRVEILEMEK